MRPVDDVPSIYATPGVLGSADAPLERQAMYDGADLTVAVYRGGDGDATVSVFQQPGRVAWDELPASALMDVVAQPAWLRPGSPSVLVTEIGDLAVTLVSDDPARFAEVVSTLDAPRRTSTADRVHDSCQRLMQVFALGG